jgi:hypothetical protein
MKAPAMTPEMVLKVKATKARIPELEKLVLNNANSPSPVSWRQLALDEGVALNTILRIVKAYRQINRIPGSFVSRTWRPPKTIVVPAAPTEPKNGKFDLSEAILTLLGTGDAQDPLIRRKMLALIAAHSTDNNRLGAISKLEELDRMSGARIGPPEPQTDEEYAARLGLILYAAGPERTQMAINWAAKHKEDEIAKAATDSVGSSGHEDGPPEGHGPGPGESSPIPGREGSGSSGTGLPTPLHTPALSVGG